MANFVGKMGVASADIGNCTIYSQRGNPRNNHHSRTFSRELEKINNLRTFSFVDYSRSTVPYSTVVLCIYIIR